MGVQAAESAYAETVAALETSTQKAEKKFFVTFFLLSDSLAQVDAHCQRTIFSHLPAFETILPHSPFEPTYFPRMNL